jgi:hypothetical protein
MVLPKLQLLDLFSVNYSVSAFRRSFNWDNYQKASTPMTCRLGLFDPGMALICPNLYENQFTLIAGYGGTSLLGEWLSYATSGNRIIMLDLNADSQLNSQRNLLYLRGLPATLSTKMVWGERRLDFWRCMSNAYLSVYSFSIAGYQLGQGVNDGFNGNAIVSLSLSRQYLSLPDILFKEV